jgi:hypothetical protein
MAMQHWSGVYSAQEPLLPAKPSSRRNKNGGLEKTWQGDATVGNKHGT